MMKTIRSIALIGVLVFLAVTGSGASSQVLNPWEVDTPVGTVATSISYQGRLVDATTGAPLSGTYDLEFTFWTLSSGGSQVGATVTRSAQTITGGLYSTTLPVAQADVNGQELWLRIRVRATGGTYETLSPRIQVLPTAYALSLVPGAEIQGTPSAWDGGVVNVGMSGTYPAAGAVVGTTATGSAVRGTSTGGFGLSGYTEDGYAVYGNDAGSTSARGYGGYFTSSNGIGVYGYSSATPYYSNSYAPGVYGRSANGVGVYGLGNADSGVVGESSSDSGVIGRTSSGEFANSAGVWGSASGDAGVGVRGYRYGIGAGVEGTTYGTSSGSGVIGSSESFVGVWAESGNGNGLQAQTDRTDHNYGVYTSDNIYSLNYHLMGAMMQVVQNGGTATLEPGDVVVFSGMAAPLEENGTPVIRIDGATSANSTAVAGVVYSRFNIEAVTGERQADGSDSTSDVEVTPAGPVAPGEYLLLVVQGPAQVKASALAGAVRPGDLLSTAGQVGYAGKAATVSIEGVSAAVPGIAFGKALEPLDTGKDLIYVYVTLQ